MLRNFLSYSLAVILILALALSGCGGGGGGGKTTPTTSDSDLINELVDRYQSGMANKNAELVASLWTYPMTIEWLKFDVDDAGEMIAELSKIFMVIKSWDEIYSNRIIKVNGDRATVDAYLHAVITYTSGSPLDLKAYPVKIEISKIDGVWKLSKILNSIDIEYYMINGLLDQYQTAMKNMDVDTLVSLCRFPFTDNSVQYKDADEMKTAYQTKFAQTESFSVYEIKNRVFKEGIVNMLTASIHIKKKPLGGDWLEYIEEYDIGAEKVGGVWKVLGMVRK